jgi:hypothetical protein
LLTDATTGQRRTVWTETVADTSWGYPDGVAQVAVLPGNLVLTTPVLEDANSLFNTIVVRYKALVPDVEVRIQWRSAEMAEGTLNPGVQIGLEAPSRDFRIAKFVIPTVDETDSSTTVRQLVLTVGAESGTAQPVLQVDYILFAF